MDELTSRGEHHNMTTVYEQTEKTERGNIPKFPRFYIKYVEGMYSIYHRFTHCYLETYTTVEGTAEALEEWNKINQQDLWSYLLFERKAFLVKPLDFAKRFEHEEEWYFNAWGTHTAIFFDKYPHLFIEEVEMPYSIAHDVKKKALEKEWLKYSLMQKEREQAVVKLDAEAKEIRRREKEGIVTVEIGNTIQAEKVIKKKRLKPIRVKKKKGSLLKVAIVSDNPFD